MHSPSVLVNIKIFILGSIFPFNIYSHLVYMYIEMSFWINFGYFQTFDI